jgi:DNA-binding XRE family transcriptional regulator
MENNYQDLLNVTAGIVETARRNAGMTQKDLANSLGVIQSTISRIEKGILSPTLFHWIEMCELLKIPQDAISVGYLDHASTTRIKSDI